jgi:hypothetical protein
MTERTDGTEEIESSPDKTAPTDRAVRTNQCRGASTDVPPVRYSDVAGPEPQNPKHPQTWRARQSPPGRARPAGFEPATRCLEDPASGFGTGRDLVSPPSASPSRTGMSQDGCYKRVLYGIEALNTAWLLPRPMRAELAILVLVSRQSQERKTRDA